MEVRGSPSFRLLEKLGGSKEAEEIKARNCRVGFANVRHLSLANLGIPSFSFPGSPPSPKFRPAHPRKKTGKGETQNLPNNDAARSLLFRGDALIVLVLRREKKFLFRSLRLYREKGSGRVGDGISAWSGQLGGRF